MGEANKVVSLLIGLFVVIVIFSVVASRIGLPERLRGLSTPADETAVTPTPSTGPQIDIKKQLTNAETKQQPEVVSTGGEKGSMTAYAPVADNTIVTKGGVEQIPATGAPTLLIPILLSGLAGGMYLRKKF